MFERKPDLDVVYIPWDPDHIDPDEAVEVGAAWLRNEPRDHLVLLHAKKMYSNNPLLPNLTSQAKVANPNSVWNSGWRGGAILAPWPSEKVLAAISDGLGNRAESVCVICWGDHDPAVDAWLAAHGAINLITGESIAAEDSGLHPVVLVAMEQMSRAVNHNNGLVSYYEKSYAVRTLQALTNGGYVYDVDRLCAWALANGFSSTEIPRLREYATRVQACESQSLLAFDADVKVALGANGLAVED